MMFKGQPEPFHGGNPLKQNLESHLCTVCNGIPMLYRGEQTRIYRKTGNLSSPSSKSSILRNNNSSREIV